MSIYLFIYSSIHPWWTSQPSFTLLISVNIHLYRSLYLCLVYLSIYLTISIYLSVHLTAKFHFVNLGNLHLWGRLHIYFLSIILLVISLPKIHVSYGTFMILFIFYLIICLSIYLTSNLSFYPFIYKYISVVEIFINF